MRPALPLITALAVSAALAVPASAADRPKVKLDRTCYVSGQQSTVNVTGSGFTPGKTFVLKTEEDRGARLESPVSVPGTVAPDGTVSVSFPTPKLQPGDSSDLTLAIYEDGSDGDSGYTKLHLTSHAVGLMPQWGSDYYMVVDTDAKLSTAAKQRRLKHSDKVNFLGFGFNGGLMPDKPTFLWLHYVAPNGRSVRDEYMATVRGCGDARTLSGRPLFRGVAHRPKAGMWHFQFDLQRRYSKATKDRKVINVKIDRKGYATFPGDPIRDFSD